MRRRTNHLGQELRPDITLVRVHNHVPEDLPNVSASQKTPAAKNFEKQRSQMSTLSLRVDPGWQNQPNHRVTDTLVGARLDDHSEDQEVCGVENVLRQMELHVAATTTISARKMMITHFQCEGVMLRVENMWYLEPHARAKLLRSMRLWLV